MIRFQAEMKNIDAPPQPSAKSKSKSATDGAEIVDSCDSEQSHEYEMRVKAM